MSSMKHEKWRPSLWFVLGGVLAGTLALSVAGLIAFRYLGPEIGYKRAAVFLTFIIGLLTAIPWLLLLRLLLRPVSALSEYAAATRQSPHKSHLAPTKFGTREMRAMGQSVIAMAATLQNRETTIRSYTDHVTHELKTPVSAIRAASELLEDSKSLTDADRKLVDQIAGAGLQIDAQLDALRMAAAAREADYHGQTNLDDIEDSLKTICPGLVVEITGGDVPVPLAKTGLNILFHHLIGNAKKHGAGHIKIEATQLTDGVMVEVSDDGTGISPGNRPHVFEPFFTTRRADGGTGMGLAIVDNLLRSHGATIALKPQGPGAQFLIRFANIVVPV